MHGRTAAIAIVTVLGLTAAASALAQQQEPRRPTLSERLQRFRQDVFGTSDENRPRPSLENQPSVAGASRKSMGSQRPVMVAPPAPQPTLSSGEMQVPATSGSGRVEVPQRMQIQSARRAQSGSPPVTVITPGSNRGVVEEARRRTFGEPVEAVEEEPYDEQLDSQEPTLAAEPEPSEEAAVEISESADGNADGNYVEQVQPQEVAPAEEVGEAIEPAPQSSKFSNALRPAVEPQPVEVVEQPSVDEPSVAEPAVEQYQPESLATESEPTLEEQPADDLLFTAKSPVLSVAAAGPRTVMIGKEAEFLVRVKNTGAPANNVVVKIVIPSYADVAQCRATVGTAQPSTQSEINAGLEWTIDRLEQGSEETLTLKLIPRKSSPLDLAINYTFTPETTQTMVEVQEPKLAMSLSGPSEVLFGQTKVYKLTISNPGNGDTHNVSVGLQPIGHGGEAPGNHRLGTLLAGESKTIDIELTARQAGTIDIKAQSFADGGLRAEASQEVRVRRAELKVAVEAPQVKYAGTPSTYQIVVENSGDAMADGVTLSAILPPEAKFLSASGGRLDPQQARVTWNVGSLPAGGQRSFELQCALHTPGENRLQVAVQGGNDLSAATTSATHVEAIADLKLEVRDPQGPVAVGEDAVYEIRVRNRGTKAAQEIDLAVFFSEGLEPSSADGGNHEIGEGQVIFQPVSTLAAGDTAVFHVRAKAQAAGHHVFRAEVVCESLDTKLAAEEATHFYGDELPVSRTARREPTLAKPVESQDRPPVNPYE